ncbi:hypothetical protein [Pontibacter sp. G13]|uniref:hypothetical protein n=1 Tax=Pontibacter sp. G13 TaxID=3074898 RepID=UPI00288A8886|nr:hypothetical protein [Pontibacter sp. G13]WNJ18885.1 hypothetical protein RJD25_00215 [Pontibacter sp. G13]
MNSCLPVFFLYLLICAWHPVVQAQFSPDSLEALSKVVALPHAHSHNDYEQQHPLSDALFLGFTSIEVDIWVHHSELLVGHTKGQAKSRNQNIEDLYFKPLAKIFEELGNHPFHEYQGPILLFVDIKNEPALAFMMIEKLAKEYAWMFQTPEFPDRPAKLILTGKREIVPILEESDRISTIDGTMEDLSKRISTDAMPTIGVSYKEVMFWNGKGQIPPNDQQVLESIVRQVHRQDKQLRIWGAPDRPEVWRAFLVAGVDLINTDHLEDFKEVAELWMTID